MEYLVNICKHGETKFIDIIFKRQRSQYDSSANTLIVYHNDESTMKTILFLYFYIQSFLWNIDTSVFDFWWCVIWVSRPE